MELIGFFTNQKEEKNKNGIISIADNDNISVSNINRQF